MVCVYGLSHAPALLLLEFPQLRGRGAFLLFFLVRRGAAGAQIVQEVGEPPAAPPPGRAPASAAAFSLRAWGARRAGAAALVGALLYWITPFKAGQALAIGVHRRAAAARWANS